ncbi:MAG: GAF domain-containing protein [Sandaracinaceae bacterium]
MLRVHNETLHDLVLQLRRAPRSAHEELERITEASARVLEVKRVSVWRFTDDGRALVCDDLYEAASGVHTRGARLEADAAPSYFAACAAARTVAVRDALTDPRTCELHAYLTSHDIASLLDAPIFAGSRALGILCHEAIGRPREWNEEERAFAASLADLASLSILTYERRVQDALYRATVDDQTDLLVRTDRDGKIILANLAARSMLGLSPGEEIGRDVLDFAVPEDRGIVVDEVRRLSPERPTGRYSHRVLLPDGSHATIEWRVRALFEEGDLVGYQSVGHDVTDERRRDEALRAAQRLEALAVFAGGMAHDLNNLLTPILLYTDGVLARASLSELDDQALREVVGAALRAREIVRQVLAFARPAGESSVE